MAAERSNDEIRALFEAFLAAPTFMRTLGVRLDDCGPGRCTLALDLRPELLQHAGTAHGAVIGALGDNAAGMAAGTLVPTGFVTVTAEYRISFLAPAAGARLIARGTVLKPGRSLFHTKADVFVTSHRGEERHVAALLATMVPFEMKGVRPAGAASEAGG